MINKNKVFNKRLDNSISKENLNQSFQPKQIDT
jgi:hypothetical protein